jgi:DNA-binding transcriptional MerR regulator
MSEPRFPTTLCRTEPEQFTLERLAAWTGVPPGRMQHYMEYGLIEPTQHVGSQPLFDVACVARLQQIERLRRDLGVNLAGIAVILDLLDRLTALQREVAHWRART